jgi:predicted permease
MRVPASGRTLLRAPGYSALVIVTLALAVGANVVVFTLVNALWLRPPPVADPGRVVLISTLVVNSDAINDMVRRDRLDRLRELPVFESVAGQVADGGLMGEYRPRLVLDRVGRAVEAAGVTHEYFSTLGIPITGRDFTAADDRADAAPTAIISDRLWRSAFGARVDLVGTMVPSSHGSVQIVGVAAAGFQGARRGERFDIWVPSRLVLRLGSFRPALGIATDSVPSILGMTPFVGLARLRPGMTVPQAADSVSTADPRARLVVRPLGEIYASPTQPSRAVDELLVLRVVTLTAGLVLIAGCVTLAAIVLVHYERRRPELAVRLALGASRRRLTGRLASELGVLALAGMGAALLIARWALASLPALQLPGGVQIERLDLGLDEPAFAVATILALIAMLAAGLLPLLRFTRPALATNLTSGWTTGSPASLRFRRVLLAIHAAATLVVLVGAGLFVQTMRHGFNRAAGFAVDRTLFLSVQPSAAEFLDPRDGGDQAAMDTRKRAAYERLVSELASLPAVRAVAIGAAPIRPDASDAPAPSTVYVDGAETRHLIQFTSGGEGYASALGVRMLAGRELGAADWRTEAVLVTRSFAQSLWPDGAWLGRRFERRSGSSKANPDGERQGHQVVGVIDDLPFGSVRSQTRAGIVTPATVDRAMLSTGLSVIVGTQGPADTARVPVIHVAQRLFPSAVKLSIDSGRDLVARDLGRQQLGAWFFSGFGIVAIGLGVAGVFGLVAYLAESRRRELGVRIALGATPARLLRSAVGTGLWPIAVGTAGGLSIAAWFAHTVDSLLLGVGRLDALTYAGAGALMIACALAAGLIAARRVRRISPMDALRAE